MKKSKKILVTGGAGFVGSHLCELLLSKGHQVTCVDNLSTGTLTNVTELAKYKRFEFLKLDVTERFESDAEEIYHLACPASPIHYQSDPVQTLKTSVLGAINVLEIAKKNGARALLASTSEVYGDPKIHPQHEGYWGNVNPIGVRSCYDEGKRCAETLFFDYYRQYGTDIRVVRIFNTYGPRMNPDDGRVVSNFIVQALKGRDLTIYGDGSQTRSFQYVEDLIASIFLMMNNELNFQGPVNLGNPVEYTIIQLANEIIRLMPESRSRIIYRPLPSDDPKLRRPDISIAKKILGWSPKINLEVGLIRTVKYFEKIV